jgi:hypothetical protein
MVPASKRVAKIGRLAETQGTRESSTVISVSRKYFMATSARD